MSIRIATFNCENLFRRPIVFGSGNDPIRDAVLEDFRKLIEILDHDTYTANDKTKIIELLKKHSVDVSQEISTQTILVNEPRGRARLLKGEGRNIEVRAEATGRSAWVGWAELVKDDLSWDAVKNTARVIAEVNADILLTVEVEDRLTLHRFNQQVMAYQFEAEPYPFNMLIDGNDIRGIDVGLFEAGTRSPPYARTSSTRRIPGTSSAGTARNSRSTSMANRSGSSGTTSRASAAAEAATSASFRASASPSSTRPRSSARPMS